MARQALVHPSTEHSGVTSETSSRGIAQVTGYYSRAPPSAILSLLLSLMDSQVAVVMDTTWELGTWANPVPKRTQRP